MSETLSLERGYTRLRSLLHKRVAQAADRHRAARDRAMRSARAHRDHIEHDTFPAYADMLRRAACTFVGIAREHNHRLVICLRSLRHPL